MTQNIVNLEEINEQIQALIDSGDTDNLLGLHSGPSFVPPRPFLTDGLQENTRFMPIATGQGKSIMKGFAEMAEKQNRQIEAGSMPTDNINVTFTHEDEKEHANFNRPLKEHKGDIAAAISSYMSDKFFDLRRGRPDLMIIDDPIIREPRFEKTLQEFSADLIKGYQKMIESIEGKEGPSFSQRKFWEGQYTQSPTQQSNSAFGFTDVVKIEVEQSAYDKLKEVAIAGHDRIMFHTQWSCEVLAIDCVPVFVNDELAGKGFCNIYTHKAEPINLAFYPENITYLKDQ